MDSMRLSHTLGTQPNMRISVLQHGAHLYLIFTSLLFQSFSLPVIVCTRSLRDTAKAWVVAVFCDVCKGLFVPQTHGAIQNIFSWGSFDSWE